MLARSTTTPSDTSSQTEQFDCVWTGQAPEDDLHVVSLEI